MPKTDKAEPKAQIERRFVPSSELRLTNNDDGLPTIHGYAAVFDKLSVVLWDFREKVAPGAFKRTLAEGADVRALVDHESARIIGRNKAGTLDLAEDVKGLKADITPPDTTVGRDIVESIRRGDVTGMSFGFVTVKDEWERGKEGELDIRTLLDVDLFDVSVVTYPAYPDTSVGVRKEDVAVALRSREEWRKVAGAAAEAAAEAEADAQADAEADPDGPNGPPMRAAPQPEPEVEAKTQPAPEPDKPAPGAADIHQTCVANEEIRKLDALAQRLGVSTEPSK